MSLMDIINPQYVIPTAAETSLEAFRELLERRRIVGLKLETFRWVLENQDCPKYAGGVSQFDISEAHPGEAELKYRRRFAELVRVGLLKPVGFKKNQAGRRVMMYRTTEAAAVGSGGVNRIRQSARLALEAAEAAVIKAGLSPDLSIRSLLRSINEP